MKSLLSAALLAIFLTEPTLADDADNDLIELEPAPPANSRRHAAVLADWAWENARPDTAAVANAPVRQAAPGSAAEPGPFTELVLQAAYPLTREFFRPFWTEFAFPLPTEETEPRGLDGFVIAYD